MAWILLLTAGLLEIGWAIGLKYSDGLRKPGESFLTITAMIVSMGLLAQAARTLPIGTAYAVWTGIGAAGTALVAMVLLGESRHWLRVTCILLIVIGIVGLKFTTPPSAPAAVGAVQADDTVEEGKAEP